MNVIFPSGHQYVSNFNVAIFRVVSARIQIHLQCVVLTSQLKPQSFGKKIRLNGKQR